MTILSENMPPQPSLGEQLNKHNTASLIRSYHSEYEEYLKDESRTVGIAESISFPKSEDEVKEILCYCYSHSLTVTIQGGRTGLAAAAVPNGGHVMNLSRMKKVLGCRKGEDGEFYLSVQPGVVLSQLKKNIESKKFDTTGWSEESLTALGGFFEAPTQFFPPDPTESSATIGGMVACNASGARSFLYGATRAHISGLRVVLSDGDTLSLKRGESFAKGRLLSLTTEQGQSFSINLPTFVMPKTKNASGYYIDDNMDAIDLFIGSDGTLGVISEIEVALLPLPLVIWGVTCFFAKESDVVDAVNQLRTENLSIAAMEYFDGDALEVLRVQRSTNPAFSKLPLVEPSAKAALYIELHCDDEADAAQKLFALGDVLDNFGSSQNNTWVARNQSDLDRLMFFRHAVPESVNMLIDKRKQQDSSITKLGTDMSVPNQHLGRVVELYRRCLKEQNLESAVWGHIGDNHLHVNILPRNREDYAKGKVLYEQWAQEVCSMGGAVSAEHGVGKLKAHLLKLMYGEEHISEMRALKLVFDPKGLLGAGTMMERSNETI